MLPNDGPLSGSIAPVIQASPFARLFLNIVFVSWSGGRLQSPSCWVEGCLQWFSGEVVPVIECCVGWRLQVLSREALEIV